VSCIIVDLLKLWTLNLTHKQCHLSRVCQCMSGGRTDSGLRSALSDHMPRMLLTRRLGTVSGNEIRYSSGYENEDRACILRAYPLADARAVTLFPPVHTKLSYIASRMATQRDHEEHNQMILNACVLLDGL
jgi:hypothetical protein